LTWAFSLSGTCADQEASKAKPAKVCAAGAAWWGGLFDQFPLSFHGLYCHIRGNELL